ncbi:MAG: hypothetical protein ORN85_04470 [Sediminibacterium sp.]|nr:hypothetical protein [Sediminibacterium sp.]
MLESELIILFNDGLLPKSLWTHQAHLNVGQWHIENYDFYEAHCILKAKIILLNHFHNTVNDGKNGYHETLTMFWLQILAIGLNETKHSNVINMDTFKENICTKELALKFYSRGVLFSPKARAIFMEPDIMKIELETIKAML